MDSDREMCSKIDTAIVLDDVDALEKLISEGLDVNKKYDLAFLYGHSMPLMAAVCAGSINLVKLLLKSNADVNCIDSYGKTPLHHVWHMADCDPSVKLACVKYLVDYGANINALDQFDYTPLIENISYFEIAKYLCENGADPNLGSSGSYSALDLVCGPINYHNDIRVGRMLLYFGADPGHIGRDGLTSRARASEYKRVGVFEWWDKINIVWDMWIMECTNMTNMVQSLPKEMVEDVLKLL